MQCRHLSLNPGAYGLYHASPPNDTDLQPIHMSSVDGPLLPSLPNRHTSPVGQSHLSKPTVDVIYRHHIFSFRGILPRHPRHSMGCLQIGQRGRENGRARRVVLCFRHTKFIFHFQCLMLPSSGGYSTPGQGLLPDSKCFFSLPVVRLPMPLIQQRAPRK